MSESSPKRAGHPTLYRSEYCQDIVDYFENFTCDEDHRFPTCAGWLWKIGIHKDTFAEWQKVHKEFSDAVKLVKTIQEDKLVTNGLMGKYNAGIVQFILKNNHDHKDKQEVEQTNFNKQETIEEYLQRISKKD